MIAAELWKIFAILRGPQDQMQIDAPGSLVGDVARR